MNLESLQPSWWKQAACLYEGSHIFFGTDDAPSSLRYARGFCSQCPVIRDCLEHALTQPEEYGIWAGTSSSNREIMRRDMEQGFLMEEIIEEVVTNDFRWRRTYERRRLDPA